MAIEIPLRKKYRVVSRGSQRSRNSGTGGSGGLEGKNRRKMQPALAAEQTRRQLAGGIPTLLVRAGGKKRMVRLQP